MDGLSGLIKKTAVIVTAVIMILSIALFATACEDSEKDSDKKGGVTDTVISVMTYNIRCIGIDNSEEMFGKLQISKRLPRIIANIQDESPDLLGCEECIEQHYVGLTEALDDEYDNYIVYRDDGISPEATPIFWKKSVFTLLDKGAFWFSKTPDVMSLYTEGSEVAGNNRVCTWVKLKHTASGKELYYYSTHFGFGKTEVPYSINLLNTRMELDAPCILTGDFNLSPETAAYASLAETFSDARSAPVNMSGTSTYNGYSQTGGAEIDFVFFTGSNFDALTHKVVNTDIEHFGEGNYSSDHYAVVAELKIK